VVRLHEAVCEAEAALLLAPEIADGAAEELRVKAAWNC